MAGAEAWAKMLLGQSGQFGFTRTGRPHQMRGKVWVYQRGGPDSGKQRNGCGITRNADHPQAGLDGGDQFLTSGRVREPEALESVRQMHLNIGQRACRAKSAPSIEVDPLAANLPPS